MEANMIEKRKALYIDNDDMILKDIDFEIDFSLSSKITRYIDHWSGVLIDWNDNLPVGVL